MKRIYLDHAATTPLDPKVRKAMLPFLAKQFGNPSALYKEGVVAREAVEGARQQIARAIFAHPDEIVFTAGGTESDNLAITGIVKKYFQTHGAGQKPHVIISAIEHPAVRSVAKELEARGTIELSILGVSHEGLVDPKEVKETLRDNTILVSVMHANNEIGTIEPIREITKVVRDHKKQKGGVYPYVHTDACQSFGYLDMHVERLGVDMMTFNGSKIYGPKGIGALYIKRGVMIAPLVYGGDQERGLRSGTENVASIVGFAKAIEIAEALKEKDGARLAALRDYFWEQLQNHIIGIHVNGSLTERLPNNLNISLPGIDNLEFIMRLDAKGVACSAKSACKSSDEETSYVIMALGNVAQETASSVRFSLGRGTTKRDIDRTVKTIREVIVRMGGS